jgi:hypothetical protein
VFPIFIKQRNVSPDEWIIVNLEVIDDDSEDGDVSVSRQAGKPTTGQDLKSALTILDQKSKSADAVVPPIPAGFAGSGEPYFCPPVTLPPYPIGYTDQGDAFYQKSPVVRPIPFGLSILGTRFYQSGVGAKETPRNQIAGYDNLGQPYFLPKHCTLATPAGFTVDGIPYYDIISFVSQKGVLLFSKALERIQSEFVSKVRVPSALSRGRAVTGDGTSTQSMATVFNVLEKNSLETPEKVSFDKPILRVQEFGMKESLFSSGEISDEFIVDPPDILEFLRESEDLAYCSPANVKISLDSSTLEFQSVNAVLSKTNLIRYKAPRGDREEREFFISVQPAGIFKTLMFDMSLQGDQNVQVAVSFNPEAIRMGEQVRGSLDVIDESGKKMASCVLLGARQSLIRASPSIVDAGI